MDCTSRSFREVKVVADHGVAQTSVAPRIRAGLDEVNPGPTVPEESRICGWMGAMSTRHSTSRRRQFTQPENPAEQALWSLRSHRGARLVMLRKDDEGELVPAWTRWNSCKPPGSGQCIDHLRAGGAMGWQPGSFGCIVVDVDHGDPATLAMAHPPLAYLETRRGAHLVYRAVEVNVLDNTDFEWEGLSGELKTTGFCRFHGIGAERLSGALAETDGGGPRLPLELLRPSQAILAKRRGGNHRAPRLSLLPRHDEVHEGNRNVSLFELGRHATYRFEYGDYAELERMCIEHAFAIAESFPCDRESEPKIRATGRSWAQYKWKVDTGKAAPRAGTDTRSQGGNAGESPKPRVGDKSRGGMGTKTPDTPPPGDPQGGMIKAQFTPPIPVGHGPLAQQRRSRGGKVRAERARAKNERRDRLIWRLRDEEMSYRKIAERLKRSNHKLSHMGVAKVVKKKPVGPGRARSDHSSVRCMVRQRTGRSVLDQRGEEGRASVGGGARVACPATGAGLRERTRGTSSGAGGTPTPGPRRDGHPENAAREGTALGSGVGRGVS